MLPKELPPMQTSCPSTKNEEGEWLVPDTIVFLKKICKWRVSQMSPGHSPSMAKSLPSPHLIVQTGSGVQLTGQLRERASGFPSSRQGSGICKAAQLGSQQCLPCAREDSPGGAHGALGLTLLRNGRGLQYSFLQSSLFCCLVYA